MGASSETTLHHFAIHVELHASGAQVSGAAVVVPAMEFDRELAAVQLAHTKIGAHLGEGME